MNVILIMVDVIKYVSTNQDHLNVDVKVVTNLLTTRKNV